MGIPASRRIRSNREFLKVRNLGRRVHTAPFILNVQTADEADLPARLGIVASRRVGNAVKRNYGKRLLREIFRRHCASIPNGVNVVVVLRSGFDGCDFAALERHFCRALTQLIGPAGASGDKRR